MKKIISGMALFLFLVGCASFHTPQDLEQVKVYKNGKPTRAYKAIETVSATKRGILGMSKSNDEIVLELRDKAYNLGADALITWTDSGNEVSAVAVKYVK